MNGTLAAPDRDRLPMGVGTRHRSVVGQLRFRGRCEPPSPTAASSKKQSAYGEVMNLQEGVSTFSFTSNSGAALERGSQAPDPTKPL